MMPTSDILSLGHHSEWHLPAPKGETQECRAPCARPGGRAYSYVRGASVLRLWASSFLLYFCGWPVAAQGSSGSYPLRQRVLVWDEGGAVRLHPTAISAPLARHPRGHCSGDCPPRCPFWGRPVSPVSKLSSVQLWILSQKLVPALCNLGLALLAHHVPYGVEAVRGIQARPAQADTHSRLPAWGYTPWC